MNAIAFGSGLVYPHSMVDRISVDREIALLEQLEEGGVRTQTSLAKRVRVSVGLTNAFLRRAVRKGLVKVQAVPARRYAYYLTPQGFAEKSRLVTEYLTTSLAFFRRARAEYVTSLRAAKERGAEGVVFVGGGELSEIALLAALEAQLPVLGGVAAGDAAAQPPPGVARLDDLGAAPPEAILLITDARTPQDTYDALRATVSPERILAPALLRVATAGEAAAPEARVQRGSAA